MFFFLGYLVLRPIVRLVAGKPKSINEFCLHRRRAPKIVGPSPGAPV